jgi:isochorismate synthase
MKQNPVTITSEPILDSTQESILRSLFDYARGNNSGLAVWRLPNAVQNQAILSYSVEPFQLDVPFEELPFGFVFHPFSKKKQGAFLKADRVFRFVEGKLKMSDDPVGEESLNWFREHLANRSFKIKKPTIPSSLPASKSKNEFEELVRKCLQSIHHGEFEKVVPSRCKMVSLPENFDIASAFRNLCNAYPNALISYTYTPEHGGWLGATPEVLVSIEEKSIFRTVALAGTQPYRTGTNLRNVAWTQKEIEEQALVSRYIINCFKKIRLREFDEHGPKTVVAGNLMHLKTDLTVDMNATHFPQLGSVMLRLLHPTSAVCGMPMEQAEQFLLQHEGYDRSFYSGFLGPINDQENSHLFVNLRCMQVLGNQAVCYAGAGVTIDSIPEKEWEETEIKMNTLLEVII